MCDSKSTILGEQISVWQHYVPKMYLRNFATIILKKKKNVALVSFYQFDQKLLKSDISIESICAEDYFYDKDNHIEHMLSEKEGAWASCFSEIISNKDNEELSDEQKRLIKEFAIFQYMRTLGENEHLKEMSRELYFTLFHEEYPDYPKGIVKDVIRKKIDECITPNIHIEMTSKLEIEIEDLELRVIKNKTEEPFITSDVPVILTNAFANNGGGGLSNIGAILFFPISEWHMIVIYDGKLYKNVANQIDDISEIKKLNQYQVISAEQRIIARQKETLNQYVNNSVLLKRRNDIRNKNGNTIASAEDKPGAIINAKSRNVLYDIRLKIFALPLEYKRIPHEAREVFPRKYKSDTRNALLMRAVNIRNIYKEILGDNVPNYERKRIQNGYKELLNLYDDYWGAPAEDRIQPDSVKAMPYKGSFFKIDG